MINYTIVAIDAVTCAELKVHFPAVSQLMAQAWAELCFRNNAWKSAVLYANNQEVWSNAK